MKYESPQISRESCESVLHCQMQGFVPKGLNEKTYKIISALRKSTSNSFYPSADFKINGLTKEEVFIISKELSDYNLGRIVFPYNTNCLEVCPVEDPLDFATQYRILTYNIAKRDSELCKDIANMAEDGYQLVTFAYIPEANIYAGKFLKR